MVEQTIRTVDRNIAFKAVTASRGKAVRAEPVSALYEQGKVHHIGRFDKLENEMVSWQPSSSSWSPNRLDALVWVLTELMLGSGGIVAACVGSDTPDPREYSVFGRLWDQAPRPPSVWDEDYDEFDDWPRIFVGDYS